MEKRIIKNIKHLASIVIFVIIFQYIGVILPFIEVRAEGEDTTLTFYDENLYNIIKDGISEYILDENPGLLILRVNSSIKTDLTELDLSDANIQNITGLHVLNGLKKLNLSHNQIEDFGPILKEENMSLKNLEELDLSYNPINSEKLDFKYLKKLKKLNLAYTNLKDLNCFSSYNSNNRLRLTNLNLEGNKIENITKLNYVKDSTFNLNLNNQSYSMNILKREENIPGIFSQVRSYNNNQENIYECEGCQINNGRVIVNDDFYAEDTATFTVQNGVLQGTSCTVKAEEDVTIEFIKEGNILYIEPYSNGEKLYYGDVELEYTLNGGEKQGYEGYIQLQEGLNTIKIYYFGKEIASKEIESISRINVLKKDGKIEIYSSFYDDINYSLSGNEDDYNIYSGPFEVDDNITNIYVKVGENEPELITIQSLSNEKIIDWSTESINSKRFIGRANGKIYIAPFKYTTDMGFMYSFDGETWETKGQEGTIENPNAEKLYITRRKWDYNINGYVNDYSEHYEYDIYDVVTDNPNDSLQDIIPHYENFITNPDYNAELLLQLKNNTALNLADSTFGIYKNGDKAFKYGKTAIDIKQDDENINGDSEENNEPPPFNIGEIISPFLDLDGNSETPLIYDETKLQEYADNDIVEFTDTLVDIFALKTDGKIYKVTGVNKDKELELELVDEQAEYKTINGVFAVDSENKVWKYGYDRVNNKYKYVQTDYVTLEGQRAKKIRTLTFYGKNIPCILYENGSVKLYYNDNGSDPINGVVDIASFGDDLRILFPYSVGAISQIGIVDLEEILEEDEFALSINDNGDLLTSKGRVLKAIVDPETGTVSYNNEHAIEEISAIGNYSYKDNSENIYYSRENLKAVSKVDDIRITKNNSDLDHNKVTINVEVPENTYRITKPDGNETLDNNIAYEVTENGRYVFRFTDTNGIEQLRVVHVNNIQSRKATKVPQVSILENKIKLESDEQIEYSTDFLTWKDYVKELDYQEGSNIYARIKNNDFECSILKISKNVQGLWDIQNTESREIQKEILTNSIGLNDKKDTIKYNKGLNEKKDNHTSLFDIISQIADNIIYSFSATDGKCAGCVKYENNKSQLTYKDINNSVVDINIEESINEGNIDISYSVVADDKYAYIDNSGNLVTNVEILTKLKEYLGEDVKYTKIVGDGVTFYVLTEEGEVYFVSEGDNQTYYYIHKRRYNTEPEGYNWKACAPKYVILNLNLKNIIDIFDSCTGLTKDGNIVSLIKDNKEEASVVQELQKQTDKYLLASHIGLKNGKLYDYSDVNQAREVTAGEIISTDEGGYGIYSSIDKIIALYKKDDSNKPIIPDLAENESYVDVQESDEEVPEFVDIAEYRDSYLLALAYKYSPEETSGEKNYNTPDVYTRCYAITKNGDLWAYIGGYIVNTGVNLDYFGPTVNYDLNNSNWTNQDVELKYSANTTNRITETSVKKGEVDLESHQVENNDNLWNATITKNGVYTVTVKDAKNRTYTTDLKVENIDKIAPRISIGSIQDGTVAITGNDIDDENGEYGNSKIAKIQVSLEEPNEATQWETFTEELDEEEKMNVTKEGLSAGQKIYVRAIDNAGNISGITEIETPVEPERKLVALEKRVEGKTEEVNLEAVKTADVLVYSVKVTNKGNTTISTVKLTDELLNINNQEYTFDALKPGETTEILLGEYTVTQEDIDKQKPIKNVVTAENVEEPSEIETPVEPERKIVGLNKKVKGKTEGVNLDVVKEGDVLVYSVEVTNKGNTTINTVKLTDELLNINNQEYTFDTLKPGETTEILLGEYTVTQEDIDKQKPIKNVVTAENVEEPSEIETPVEPERIIVGLKKKVKGKTEGVNLDVVKEGDVLVYSVEVTNKGNTTINTVKLTDELLNINNQEYTFDALKPGETIEILLGEYTVTQEDIDKQESIKNVVTAENGEEPSEIETPVEPKLEPEPEPEPKPEPEPEPKPEPEPEPKPQPEPEPQPQSEPKKVIPIEERIITMLPYTGTKQTIIAIMIGISLITIGIVTFTRQIKR